MLPEVLRPGHDDPALLEPLAGAEAYLGVEALYAATHEGALHLEDVLTRRTRASINTADRGRRACAAVAAIIAGPLGWSTEDMDREISHYRARVEAELASQLVPDDSSADVVRREARDIAPVVAASAEAIR